MHTINLPDEVHISLEREADRLGLHNIGRLLEEWLEKAWEEELHRREALVSQIMTFHEYMHGKYGVMENSVESIREDRAR